MHNQYPVVETVIDPAEVGEFALLGLVEGAYDSSVDVGQLPVEDNTFSAYGKKYDTGMGSEG